MGSIYWVCVVLCQSYILCSLPHRFVVTTDEPSKVLQIGFSAAIFVVIDIPTQHNFRKLVFLCLLFASVADWSAFGFLCGCSLLPLF